MASAYPNSKFTGIDVSAAWPTENRPHNCNFVTGNIVQELPFEENSFDYIYMRLVAMGVPNEVYPTVLSQLHRVLKPGGWIEVVEVRKATIETFTL
jgi:ubiquinone/menaquinone biosynthesis C-methylase UbiE